LDGREHHFGVLTRSGEWRFETEVQRIVFLIEIGYTDYPSSNGKNGLKEGPHLRFTDFGWNLELQGVGWLDNSEHGKISPFQDSLEPSDFL